MKVDTVKYTVSAFIFLLAVGSECVMKSVSQILTMIQADDMSPFYNDRKWRKLSKKIKKRYHNECYLCMKKHKMSPSKVVHHVKELKRYPQYAYDEYAEGEIQLMPLCHDCHERIHHRGKYAENSEKEEAVTGFQNEEKW